MRLDDVVIAWVDGTIPTDVVGKGAAVSECGYFGGRVVRNDITVRAKVVDSTGTGFVSKMVGQRLWNS